MKIFRLSAVAAALAALSFSPAFAEPAGGDPQNSGPIVTTLGWLPGMLLSHLNWRFGATVIVGCFVVFGSAAIVAGIKGAAGWLADVADLGRAPAHRALTRPKMFGRVTFSFFIVNFAVTMETFLLTGSLLSLPVALVTHATGYLACPRESRILDLLLTKVSRTPNVRNWKRWGCSTAQS